MTKHSKKQEDLEQQLGELTLDLQRTRADFENYRKRVEADKAIAHANGRVGAIYQLLPLIDTIERAVVHIPDDLVGNAWVNGIVSLSKNLDKLLADLTITRIEATPGTVFNPHIHEAVQYDEAEGTQEVIAEELQAGYMLNGDVLRHSMVKVTRK